jgi:hypothetical protein
MENESHVPQKESISEVLKKYKQGTGKDVIADEKQMATPTSIPKPPVMSPEDYSKMMSKETDPDLMTSYEIVKLPSKGVFYSHKLSEVAVEYMTSKDEDLITTPSLIDSGELLNMLLKRKIKTPGIKPDELLAGDRNAIILFLRTSSYGADYSVQVTDPRNGITFPAKVDLLQLKYKELTEMPDENGHFRVEIPMRKKIVTFRLLTSGEDATIFKKAEAIKEAYGNDVSDYPTLKLKAHVIAINEKTDRSYIDKFIDAMPALDALTIRRKVMAVSPDVDMKYEFTTKDGYKFEAFLTLGLDFFFPST